MTSHYRAAQLSDPACDYYRGDPVWFREDQLGHEQPGTVIGRTFGCKPTRYDIETVDGRRFDNITIVRLDEDRMELKRILEGVA